MFLSGLNAAASFVCGDGLECPAHSQAARRELSEPQSPSLLGPAALLSSSRSGPVIPANALNHLGVFSDCRFWALTI